MGKNKKYKLLKDDYILEEVFGNTVVLHRIKALKSFGDVKEGDIGGYIESKRNLSYEDGDNSWVYDDARVYGLAIVRNNSTVREIATVRGTTVLTNGSDASGNSVVENAVLVSSIINGMSSAKDFCEIYNSSIRCSSCVVGRVKIRNSIIRGGSKISQSLSFPTLYIDGNIDCCDEVITGNEYGTTYGVDDNNDKDENNVSGAQAIVLIALGFAIAVILHILGGMIC